MVSVKKWNGSSWAGATVKKWNGSSWVNAVVKQTTLSGNGNTDTIDVISVSTKKKTVMSTWSNVYVQGNTKRTMNIKRLQQGQFKGDVANGINKSLIGFSLSEFKGKKVTGIRLYLKSTDWYYTTGGTAHIGWHNHSTSPKTFQHDKYSGVQVSYSQKVQEKWVDMPTAFVNGVANGTVKGVSIYYNNADWHGYGRFHAHNGEYPPKLEVTYEE